MVEQTLLEHKLPGDFEPRVVQQIMAGPKIVAVTDQACIRCKYVSGKETSEVLNDQ